MLTPRPYQLEGRNFLAARRFALLADEMRVGKTPQAILAAHKAGAKSVTVVCPAIAVPQWRAEFMRWWPADTFPHLEVMSYNKATSLWDAGKVDACDVFIPDECHFAKNPEAMRTRMVYGKTGFAQKAGATWALSGTPAPKHAAELWPMLRAFGVVRCTYDEFIRHFCVVDFGGIIRGTKERTIPELRALLAKIMLRRKRKDVAPEMPDIDYQFLEIERSSADYAIPSGLSDEALARWLEDHSTAAEQDRIAVATAKVPALVDEIHFAVHNELYAQTVVFGWHTEPLRALYQSLNGLGIKTDLIYGATSPKQREITQRQFKDGFTKVVCANIMAAGTAIDLSAARHGYFLEMDWVPGNNVQAANRLVSMEKLDKVTFDVLTAPGTTDDKVQQVLMRRVRELSQLY